MHMYIPEYVCSQECMFADPGHTPQGSLPLGGEHKLGGRGAATGGTTGTACTAGGATHTHPLPAIIIYNAPAMACKAIAHMLTDFPICVGKVEMSRF